MRLFILVAVFAVSSVFASDLSCTVVGIADGDTLTALCPGNQQIKVRLTEIDAPEKKQPFGERSRQSLADMCFQKHATITSTDKDRYGRTLGRVTCAGLDANAEQVTRGLAWVYDRYVTERGLYMLQDDARASKRGLWADKNPMPPWEWRKAKRK
jgi:endonuclease YncB( thermonuclease family)